MDTNGIKLTPKDIVSKLNEYIVGQDDAKRKVAIALRNRYRRSLLDEEAKQEIAPKNILMIGPTGVGKTEIARRMAKIVGAPFIKVEATKFTEVGYVGRDVESCLLINKFISIIISKNFSCCFNRYLSFNFFLRHQLVHHILHLLILICS